MASIPFSEPPWLAGLPSPYYHESHRSWQQHCREFISENFTQHAMQWENVGKVPDQLYQTFARNNMLLPSLPTPLPVKWLREMGVEKLGPVPIEEFDYLHNSIFISEMMRSGLNGPMSSLTTGFAYGLPLLMHFASERLQGKLLPDLFRGRTRICIAISEPDAGSDVANIQTTATKSECGKFYVVNGSKKWITNGIWSDFASTCVRTGGSGANGLSVLIVPLKAEGVSMRRMAVSGRKTSGTTFIEFDDVKVSVENLVGEEGAGMKYFMRNFNHERISIAIAVTCQARAALSAAFAYTMQREAFGKPLIDQPVVRNRLAQAGGILESQWSWVESFVYNMAKLPKDEADEKLGGLTALCKARAGLVLNECAQCAQILFGGNGYTQTGQGELVEKIAREVAGARVPGGSEDVMFDVAVRQLYKQYRRSQKPNL